MDNLDDALDNALGTGDETSHDTKETPPPKEKETKETEVSEEESNDDDTEDEVIEDESDDSEGEGEESDDDEEAEAATPKTPSVITNLKKEFPAFAKKYPQVVDAYFQVQEFKQVFGSVDDAKESAEKADVMDGMLTSLDAGDIEPVLDVLYQRDPESLQVVVANFLPTLSKKSPKLFKAVISPVINNVLARVGARAKSEGNEQLVLAVRYLNKALFKNENLPEQAEFDTVKRDLRGRVDEVNTVTQAEQIFYNGVEDRLDPILDKEINIGLDPDNAYPEGLRDTAMEQIKKQVIAKLRANESHMRTMKALRRSAIADGWSKEYQKKIARTIANAAKEIIPGVRTAVKKRLLGNMRITNGNGKGDASTPNVPNTDSNQSLSTGAGTKKSVKFEPGESIRDRMDKVLS